MAAKVMASVAVIIDAENQEALVETPSGERFKLAVCRTFSISMPLREQWSIEFDLLGFHQSVKILRPDGGTEETGVRRIGWTPPPSREIARAAKRLEEAAAELRKLSKSVEKGGG